MNKIILVFMLLLASNAYAIDLNVCYINNNNPDCVGEPLKKQIAALKKEKEVSAREFLNKFYDMVMQYGEEIQGIQVVTYMEDESSVFIHDDDLPFMRNSEGHKIYYGEHDLLR